MTPKHLDVTYLYHSGFTVDAGDILLIFDYWRGEHLELPEELWLTADKLKAYRTVYVFVSHDHPDHDDPAILDWMTAGDVNYLVAGDMEEVPEGSIRMNAGDVREMSDRVKVEAFPSTDLGVSWMVTIDGVTIFHAGDLNLWHWRNESTVEQIEQAETDFRTAVRPIEGRTPDIAFFPVDPRQGEMYDAGANYFLMAVKPRLLLPMHFWGRTDMAEEFARRSRCRDTEILTMTWMGETLSLDFDEKGAMTVTMPEDPAASMPQHTTINMGVLEGTDPFSDSDTPVDLSED